MIKELSSFADSGTRGDSRAPAFHDKCNKHLRISARRAHTRVCRCYCPRIYEIRIIAPSLRGKRAADCVAESIVALSL